MINIIFAVATMFFSVGCEKGSDQANQDYLKTTPQQDTKALRDLIGSWEEDSGKLYGLNNCRTYSQNKFEKFKKKFNKNPIPPPTRTIAPRSPFRKYQWPGVTTTTTTTTTTGGH